MEIEGFKKRAGRISLNIKITKELHSDIADLRHQAAELGGTFNVSSAVEDFLNGFVKESQIAFTKLRAGRQKRDEEQLGFDDNFDDFSKKG